MTLKDLRIQAAYTQKQLAEKIGAGEISISNWENAVTEPRIDFIRPLADALGVTIAELRQAIEQTKAQKK